MASSQVSAIFIPATFKITGFDRVFVLTTLHRLFTFVQLHGIHLTDSSAFSFALNTTTFDCSTQRWFGAYT
jgi:hypothetical protein